MTLALIISIMVGLTLLIPMCLLRAKESASSLKKNRQFYKEVSETLARPEVSIIVQRLIFDETFAVESKSSKKRKILKHNLLLTRLKVVVPDDNVRKAIHAFIYNKRSRTRKG